MIDRVLYVNLDHTCLSWSSFLSIRLTVFQHQLQDMIGQLDVLDISGVQRFLMQKAMQSLPTADGSDVFGKQDQLERKLEDIMEELRVVLLDREKLLALSNRLRADLQRALSCERTMKDSQCPQREDNVSLDTCNEGKNDLGEMMPSCQSATFINEKLQQRPSCMVKYQLVPHKVKRNRWNEC